MKRLAVGGMVFVVLGLWGPGALGGEPDSAAVGKASVSVKGRLKVIRLSGSPYEMGYQHGVLLQEEVKENAASFLRYAAARSRVPWLGRWLISRELDAAYHKMAPFIPRDYQEELRGLAAGSGVSLRDLQRIHVLPERFPISGSSLVAYGEATKDRRLLQTRNLDWDFETGLQRHPVIFVYHSTDKLSFVNLGFAGFIGVFSGVNQQGISVASMGASSADQTMQGTPMPFLLRRALEESYELEDAVRLISKASRTVGYNYLFADAVRRDAACLETNRKLSVVFHHEDSPPLPDYGVPLSDAMVRSETALDPLIRDGQICSNGNPRAPGLESPAGDVYERKYRAQAIFVQNNDGGITPEVAYLIAKESAAAANLQSVLYAYPEIWISYAEEKKPAVETQPWYLHLEELF